MFFVNLPRLSGVLSGSVLPALSPVFRRALFLVVGAFWKAASGYEKSKNLESRCGCNEWSWVLRKVEGSTAKTLPLFCPHRDNGNSRVLPPVFVRGWTLDIFGALVVLDMAEMSFIGLRHCSRFSSDSHWCGFASLFAGSLIRPRLDLRPEGSRAWLARHLSLAIWGFSGEILG
jgi:hypothetical protein